MDTKHYTTTSSENTAPVQEAVDLALYEAAKDGDLHAAFIAVQKGANPGSQHDIVRHAPLLSAACDMGVDKNMHGAFFVVRSAIRRACCGRCEALA
jgi:hypothetical protein